MQNFPQNIQKWDCHDEVGNPLKCTKISRDQWQVECSAAIEVHLSHNYYANQLDAGGSVWKDDLFYINPIAMLPYIHERIDEPCMLEISLPEGWMAGGARPDEQGRFQFGSYHHLADTPLLCSPHLFQLSYGAGGCDFHICLWGTRIGEPKRVLQAFEVFSQVQIELFGGAPFKEYWFLILSPDDGIYHGVEHSSSTVLCLGPDRKLEGELWWSLLGLSSHELFHAWNVKAIRPADWLPYDYRQAQYSYMGWAAEGITTYYGDLMLLRCGLFTFEDFSRETQRHLQRHFESNGRAHMSLAMSSWDSWVDGYRPSAPDRRVNMYYKGMLVSLMLDLRMRAATGGAESTDTLLRALWQEFGDGSGGYQQADIERMVYSRAPGVDPEFFKHYLWGTTPIEGPLNDALKLVGCQLLKTPSTLLLERAFGIRTKGEGLKVTIIGIALDSPADSAGLSVGDTIVAVEGKILTESNLAELKCEPTAQFVVQRGGKLQGYTLNAAAQTWYDVLSFAKLDSATEGQKQLYRGWAGQDW